MRLGPIEFDEVIFVDFEFTAPPGERPTPICCVAQELSSGRRHRLWHDDLVQLDRAPFPVDRRSLFVGYYASAELSCFLQLGWALPECILDPFTAPGRTSGRTATVNCR
jgi:hypothetical protein